MLTPTDIAEYGERHVKKWLTDNGFHAHRPSSTAHSHTHHGHINHNAVDLEARNDETNMMVHVRTAMAPHTAHDLTENEHHGICSRAIMLGYDAWLARVKIDGHGDLADEIVWTKLV